MSNFERNWLTRPKTLHKKLKILRFDVELCEKSLRNNLELNNVKEMTEKGHFKKSILYRLRKLLYCILCLIIWSYFQSCFTYDWEFLSKMYNGPLFSNGGMQRNIRNCDTKIPTCLQKSWAAMDAVTTQIFTKNEIICTFEYWIVSLIRLIVDEKMKLSICAVSSHYLPYWAFVFNCEIDLCVISFQILISSQLMKE